MADIEVKRVGSVLKPVDAAGEAAILEFDQFKPLRARIFQPRSKKHHGWFFALNRAAFEAVPHDFEERFDDETHFRKWAECKIDYCDKLVIEGTKDMTREQARMLANSLELAFVAERRKGTYVWLRPARAGGVAIIRPRSIAVDELDEVEFRKVVLRLIDLYYQITSLTPEELCPNSEAALKARALMESRRAA